MWYRAGSWWGDNCDWLVWAVLSRDWTMAWRRQVIHCCLLKESLACRLYEWALARPLLLTRKQFFTRRWKEEKEGERKVSLQLKQSTGDGLLTFVCVTEFTSKYETNKVCRLCDHITFIVSPCEGSSEGAPSSSLAVWDLLQIYQGIGQRLPVHVKHLTTVLVLSWSRQHQHQLK